MAMTKPRTVDSPTTEITQIKVLIITVLKAGSCTASLKFLKPTNPPITPALEISLKESLKTMRIGKTTKIEIRRMLGSSQT